MPDWPVTQPVRPAAAPQPSRARRPHHDGQGAAESSTPLRRAPAPNQFGIGSTMPLAQGPAPASALPAARNVSRAVTSDGPCPKGPGRQAGPGRGRRWQAPFGGRAQTKDCPGSRMASASPSEITPSAKITSSSALSLARRAAARSPSASGVAKLVPNQSAA